VESNEVERVKSSIPFIKINASFEYIEEFAFLRSHNNKPRHQVKVRRTKVRRVELNFTVKNIFC